MKSTFFLADAATDHREGTVTALRAFITSCSGKVRAGGKLLFVGSTVLRAEFDGSEAGKHELAIELCAPSKKPIWRAEVTLEVPAEGGVTAAVFPLRLPLDEQGVHEFRVTYNKHVVHTYPLVVRFQSVPALVGDAVASEEEHVATTG